MRSFADPLIYYKKVGEIWVKEKMQPLKTIYALFLEPHILCYVMFTNLLLLIFFFAFKKPFINTEAPTSGKNYTD